MHLILVESPTKCKTLRRFLGKEYQIAATMGHIRDLPKSKFGVDIENDFKPEYVIIPKAKKNVQFLKKEAKKADVVILSCDPDREGEAIAWHLTHILSLNGKKPYQRVVFHEITKKAIIEALKNPRKIDMNLVDAQQARRILDRIVGYKLSPFLWKKAVRGLSAGRVQSAAVRLVVEREREIENFIPQEYWSVEVLLRQQFPIPNSQFPNKSQIPNPKSETEFEALLVKKDGQTIPKLGIKTKKEADKILENLDGAEYKVINIEKKEIKRNPLPPFTTSTLQQEAWKRFHFPAKFTMQLAQQLYEKGLITYHRTDSLNLSDLSLFAAKKFIETNYGKNYWAGFFRKYKAKGRVQEAHEAIRPAYPEKSPPVFAPSSAKASVGKKAAADKEKFSEVHLKLYDLIWRRFIACQMASARLNSTSIEIEAGISNFQFPISKQIPNPKLKISKYTFKASGQVLEFDGFLKIYPMKFQETELPALEKNEILELIKLIPSQHFTQPSPRYTEASLIKVLEENGIGRPSTYAPIISTIQIRNYVEKDEKKLFHPTEIGILVNDLLVKNFPKIVDIKFTARFEEDLDEIASGQKKWTPVISEFYEPFIKNLKIKEKKVSKKELTIEKTDKICPLCKKLLVIKLGRFGKFLACSGFPECRHTEPIKKTIGVKCPKCKEGEIIEKKTKKGKIFYSCSKYPKCDFALWLKPTGEVCPKCGSLLVITKKAQTQCSNKECK